MRQQPPIAITYIHDDFPDGVVLGSSIEFYGDMHSPNGVRLVFTLAPDSISVFLDRGYAICIPGVEVPDFGKPNLRLFRGALDIDEALSTVQDVPWLLSDLQVPYGLRYFSSASRLSLSPSDSRYRRPAARFYTNASSTGLALYMDVGRVVFNPQEIRLGNFPSQDVNIDLRATHEETREYTSEEQYRPPQNDGWLIYLQAFELKDDWCGQWRDEHGLQSLALLLDSYDVDVALHLPAFQDEGEDLGWIVWKTTRPFRLFGHVRSLTTVHFDSLLFWQNTEGARLGIGKQPLRELETARAVHTAEIDVDPGASVLRYREWLPADKLELTGLVLRGSVADMELPPARWRHLELALIVAALGGFFILLGVAITPLVRALERHWSTDS